MIVSSGKIKDQQQYMLEDGAHVAVIGGGPTGAFFSIFVLKMARMLGRELSVTIFDPKDFTRDGPGGCNRCGGIVSELLVQTLAVEGINLPDSVVRKGIHSYKLHTAEGSVNIATPSHEKTIATVYRGGGPKGIIGQEKESFDQFLLDRAMEEGVEHKAVKIDRLAYNKDRLVLFSDNKTLQEADLVVGASGVNSKTSAIFEDLGFGYEKPRVITAAIAEIAMDQSFITEYLGDSIHLFLLPDKEIKFAAMIPKGSYVTLCILGSNMNIRKIDLFLDHPVVRDVLPESSQYKLECRCLPKMNVGAPKRPFADRVVLCGDAGSTRLFKDGLGAAYLMGKAAAKTAVFHGVSRENFRKNYYPVYKSIIVDNWFGKYLYFITDLYKNYRVLTKGMVAVVRQEQQDSENPKLLSSILWDMFTGNQRYKNIFGTAMNLPMHLDLWKEFGRVLLGGGHERR